MGYEEVILSESDIKIRDIKIIEIVRDDLNPNKMEVSKFDRLAHDIREGGGIVQPILVYSDDGLPPYDLIDGAHRVAAASMAMHETIPAVVVTDSVYQDRNERLKKLVRMNVLRGDMDKKKFAKLINKILHDGEKPGQLARDLAFANQDEMQSLIESSRTKLPTLEAKKEFDKKVEDGKVSTAKDLSDIVNGLIKKYGKTLDNNVMVLDFGGNKHIWVRIKDKKKYRSILKLIKVCIDSGVTFDSVISNLVSDAGVDYINENIESLERT